MHAAEPATRHPLPIRPTQCRKQGCAGASIEMNHAPHPDFCAERKAEAPGLAAKPCQRLPSGMLAEGDFDTAVRLLGPGDLDLGQSWRSHPETRFCSGRVCLGWEPQALWVLGRLADDAVHTRSTDHGQNMWELGDVFEIFVGPSGESRYLELHVTPSNHRLHLEWTANGFRDFREEREPLDAFRQRPGQFDSWVRQNQLQAEWLALVRIPAGLITGGGPMAAGRRLKVSFSRYDASPEYPPVLSSTSRHQELDFHRRHEWSHIFLAPAITAS